MSMDYAKVSKYVNDRATKRNTAWRRKGKRKHQSRQQHQTNTARYVAILLQGRFSHPRYPNTPTALIPLSVEWTQKYQFFSHWKSSASAPREILMWPPLARPPNNNSSANGRLISC